MNIIVLEDRGSVAYYMKETLAGLGHVILEAYNVNDAQSHWDRRNAVPVECMIVDLNMPPEGLSEEQRGRAKGGLLSAWIWLTDHVFPEDPTMRQRVIVYSEYLSDLEANTSKEGLTGIRRVPKRGSSVAQVINHVSDIARRSQERIN